MKVEAGLVVSLKSKLSKPCKRLIHVFKFRIKKPFSIKSLWPRRHPRTPRAISKPRRAWTWLGWLRRAAGKMEKVRGTGGDGSREELLFLSPIRRRTVVADQEAAATGGSSEDVEDACRSFENYLVEMIIEEGKVRDLMDVEELLYCWRNLKCPVFVDLVCTFYGELCKDLFSPNHQPFYKYRKCE